MGQYYKLIAQTGNDTQTYEDDGIKLMEHSYLTNPWSNFAYSALSATQPTRLYHVGDYHESGMYGQFIGGELPAPELKVSEYLAVCNIDKNEMFLVDIARGVGDSMGYDLTVDPLLLLTAMGNGRGGGDYHQGRDIDLVGRWAGDQLIMTEGLDTIRMAAYMQIITPFFTGYDQESDGIDQLIKDELSRWFTVIDYHGMKINVPTDVQYVCISEDVSGLDFFVNEPKWSELFNKYDGLHFLVSAAQVYNHVKSLGVSVKDSLVKVVC